MKTLTFLFICICLAVPCSAIDDPVAHWKLDEISGSIAYDSAGSHDGTLIGDPVWTDGQIDGALEFDGIGDYVEAVGYKGVTGTQSRTCSAWINASSAAQGKVILSWGYYSTDGQLWAIYLERANEPGVEGALSLEVQDGRVVGSTSLLDDQWHHIAVVLENDGSPIINEVKLYVDGVEEVYSYETDGQGINTAAQDNVTIGCVIWPSPAGLFNGLIDDVRIYDRALSEAEIRELAGVSNGPVAHWKFDDGSGNTAVDSVGGHTGTLTGDPSWTSGIIGGALEFDGAGDYVEAIGYKGVTGTQSRTCAAWIKADTAKVYDPEGIFSWGKYNVSGGNWSFCLQGNNGPGTPGALIVTVEDGHKVGSTDLRNGMWHHIAVVLENDGTPNAAEIKFYVDGVEETYSSIDSSAINTASYNDVMIGCDNWNLTPGPSFFNGLIDDARIYDRALSEDEITDLYHVGIVDVAVDIKPGSCPNPLNVKSKGVLPVAILGTEDFEVSTIDPASIFLNGVPSIRSSYEDVGAPVADPNECQCTTNGPDGFDDLTLKFYTQEIVETLGEVNAGDILTLSLTGVLNDEIPIEGSDCVVIVGRFKPINEADINEDGLVNTVDMAIVAENWLESSIVEK